MKIICQTEGGGVFAAMLPVIISRLQRLDQINQLATPPLVPAKTEYMNAEAKQRTAASLQVRSCQMTATGGRPRTPSISRKQSYQWEKQTLLTQMQSASKIRHCTVRPSDQSLLSPENQSLPDVRLNSLVLLLDQITGCCFLIKNVKMLN